MEITDDQGHRLHDYGDPISSTKPGGGDGPATTPRSGRTFRDKAGQLGLQLKQGVALLLSRRAIYGWLFLVCFWPPQLQAPSLKREHVELPYLTSYIQRSHNSMRGYYRSINRPDPGRISKAGARRLGQHLMELCLPLSNGTNLLYDLVLPQLRNGSGFINGVNDTDQKYWSHGIGELQRRTALGVIWRRPHLWRLLKQKPPWWQEQLQDERFNLQLTVWMTYDYAKRFQWKDEWVFTAIIAGPGTDRQVARKIRTGRKRKRLKWIWGYQQDTKQHGAWFTELEAEHG